MPAENTTVHHARQDQLAQFIIDMCDIGDEMNTEGKLPKHGIGNQFRAIVEEMSMKVSA